MFTPCVFLCVGTGKGLFGGDDRVVYWKCEAGQTLQENLCIPHSNTARDRALMLASQQVMSYLTIQSCLEILDTFYINKSPKKKNKIPMQGASNAFFVLLVPSIKNFTC